MAARTLDDLIERLEELREEHGGDLPVRIASQPSWPLAFTVENVRFIESSNDHHPSAVWFAASQGPPYLENPYAPKAAWDEE